MNGTKQMTMTEYQQAVANKLYGLNLKERVTGKDSLDESEIEEIPPIVLSGYAFEDSFDGNDVWVKVEGTQAVASSLQLPGFSSVIHKFILIHINLI